MTDCPYCGKKCFAEPSKLARPVCPDHGLLTPEDCAAAKCGSDHERADHWHGLALQERARADEVTGDADELLKLYHAELVATADGEQEVLPEGLHCAGDCGKPPAGEQWHVVPDRSPPAPTCHECGFRRALETIATDNEPAHRMRMLAKRALEVK